MLMERSRVVHVHIVNHPSACVCCCHGQMVRDMARKLDKDGDGVIDMAQLQELLAVIREEGLQITFQEVDMIAGAISSKEKTKKKTKAAEDASTH